MAMMKIVVFDVDQGQCVFIRTPSDYGILVDCGRSGSGKIASPVEWLAKNEASSLDHYSNHPLAALIVTHPKDDNLKDISALQERLSPAAVWCDTDYDWQAILASEPDENLSEYRSLLSSVEPNAEPDVDLGIAIKRFSLSPEEAAQIGGDAGQVIDNRSIVTVVTYNSAEGYTWKAVISGDNTAQGWEALLGKPEFAKEIEEADFFITSRHGQESGFSADLFKTMGKPIANISSGPEENVDKRYAKHAQGVKFPDGSRKSFATGGDGNITVEVHDDGRYDVWLFRP